MSIPGPAASGHPLRHFAVGIAAVLAIVLVARALQLLLFAGWAVSYPYELDYGEGIVWQQARLMFTARAYGPIDGFPAIVFHYPPIYHVTTLGLSGLLGIDPLAAGRLVSLAGLLASVGLIALFAWRTARAEMEAPIAAACAALAALVLLSCWPVLLWTPVMRVDFLALALSFVGLFFALRALDRPWIVHLASLFFVLAIYTKHSTIAAPAAAFTLLLLLRPRTGLAGIASAAAMGLAALAGLWWATGGGFANHLFLYNINRFEAQHLTRLIELVGQHALYFAIAGIAVKARIGRLRDDRRVSGSLAGFRRLYLAGERSATGLLLLFYLGATVAMLPLIAKSGSNYNYLIELMCAVSVFVGLGLRDVVELALRGRDPEAGPVTSFRLILAAALFAQLTLLPADRFQRLPPLPPRAELDQLSAMIRAAPKPVISDDMVLLLRSGREVPWESAIFAELASTGKFDQRPFIRKIEQGDFSFFVTYGDRGDQIFDSRYNPPVADALDRAYPRRLPLAGLIVRLPKH